MKRSNLTYAKPAPRKTKAERPCVKTWIIRDVFSDKSPAEDIAADWRVRNERTARVVEKRIKAGGVWRDFYFVVVSERTFNPHAWESAGTMSKGIVNGQGVRGLEVHQRERCKLCGAKRTRLLSTSHNTVPPED